MKTVNIYNLVSDAIEDGIGNTSSQTQNITHLFIDGLFAHKEHEIKFEFIDGANGGEYHVDFQGFIGMGSTPAQALMNLIEAILDVYFFSENGPLKSL